MVDVPPLPVGFVASHLEAGAVNGAAGLIHENQCVWRDYPPCDPRFALLDPARTWELSRRELLFQGFSALEGAMELYLDPVEGTGVSRNLLEALLRKMVQDLAACCRDLGDESARSDLMWESALWGSRFFRLGRQSSFPALPVRESAILSASDWEEYAGTLSVLLLSLCRREAERHPAAMARMACRLWKLPGPDRTEAQLAHGGVRALESLAEKLGLPVQPEQLGAAVQNRLGQLSTSQNLLVHTA